MKVRPKNSNYRIEWRRDSRDFRLFLHALMLLFLCSCSTHRPAPVYDKRSQSSSYSQSFYSVRKGDTLFAIAWRHGLDYKKLASWNRIHPPYTIYPNQTLKLFGSSAKSNVKRSTDSTRTTNKRKTTISKKSTTSRRKKSNLPVGNVRWKWPANGKIIETFHSEKNKGIDIGGEKGSAIKSAASGKVVYSGSGLRGYGKLVIIKHNDKFLSAYAHNDKLLVKEGDKVKIGQKIAEMGSTGAAENKLHFEIRSGGKPVNPIRYLPGK